MTDSMRKVQIRLIAFIGGLVLALTLLISGLLLSHTEKTMQENILSLVAANNTQMQINVDNYFRTIEKATALLFSDDSIYHFDPTDPYLSDYDRIQDKNAIQNRIVDIGLLQNYSDFCVVYSDDSDVGWISQTTSGMFPDGGIYDAFVSCIRNEKTQDGWAFGVGDNKDRFWYVKRLNPSAVIVVSFYSRELSRIFTLPDELSGMAVRLVDDEGKIMYSSDGEEIGNELPAKIVQTLPSLGPGTGSGADYLAASGTLACGWHIVSSVPLKQLTVQMQQIRSVLVMFVITLVLVFILLLSVLWKRLNAPVNTMVDSLNERASSDQLSGLLNKITYENLVQESLTKPGETAYFVYLLLDIDNFKSVNDTLGHETGDEIIRLCGRILSEAFGENALAGRVGGDEFSAFRRMDAGQSPEEIREKLTTRVTAMQERFRQEAAEISAGKIPISVSAGAVITKPDASLSFHTLYEEADHALYSVKGTEKGRFRAAILPAVEGKEADYA